MPPSNSPVPVLGYWDIRGFGEPIRLLLTYNGVKFEDKRYTDPDTWFNQDKINLGMEFPNLPYFLDGNIKMSESGAILRYLGTKYGMVGKTELEKVKCLEMEGILTDFRRNCLRVFYNTKNYEEDRENLLKNYLPPILSKFENVLTTRPWLSGESITIVDFIFHEILDVLSIFESSSLDSFPAIQNYISTFEGLENVQKYYNSPSYQKKPINGPSASFR